MSLLLKQLNEQRGAKLKKAHEITAKVTEEKRGFTDEERNEVRGLNDEIEKLNLDLTEEVRSVSNASQRPVQLSNQEERDIGRFDYAKMINHLHRSAKGSPSALDGIEAEMIQEGERDARSAGIQGGGVFLPRIFVARQNEYRDMTATGQTSVAGDQGGMTIATEKRGLLEDFYNASVVRKAGALVLEGLTGNLDIPRILTGSDPTGKSENAASDELNYTFAMLQLSPKRLPAHIDISERLLMQSSAAVEAVLRSNLKKQLLAVQERAFFHGTGSNEAQGVAGTSGIGAVIGGTNGAAPTWASLVALETAVDAVNALEGSLHYITNGQIRGKLKSTPKVTGTDSRMLYDPDMGADTINGYTPYFTNAVSKTLTKGSATAIASAIFFGDWSDYVIGYWGGISLEMVRDKTQAISGMYALVASAYYDGGVQRPKSFAAQLDALGA